MNQTCSDDLQSHRSQPARSFSDGVYLHTYYGYKQYYYMSNTDAASHLPPQHLLGDGEHREPC